MCTVHSHKGLLPRGHAEYPWSNRLAMPSPYIKSNLLESKKCLLWTTDQALHKEWAPWANIDKGA